MALLTADQVRAILRKEVKRAGSQAAWAKVWNRASRREHHPLWLKASNKAAVESLEA